MIKILRFLARAILILCALPCSVCMAFLWLFVWTPLVLIAWLFIFLVDFANGKKIDTDLFKAIMWFFWLYVLFDIKKSERYL